MISRAFMITSENHVPNEQGEANLVRRFMEEFGTIQATSIEVEAQFKSGGYDIAILKVTDSDEW